MKAKSEKLILDELNFEKAKDRSTTDKECLLIEYPCVYWRNDCAFCPIYKLKEQGKKDAYEDVLKWINDNWTEHRSFGFSIKEHLEQKIKELSK